MKHQSPPSGPLASSQHRDDVVDFKRLPLDGWKRAIEGHGRTREVQTDVGMMRLSILKASNRQWGFSIRLVTPIEGIDLGVWIDTNLVPSGEKSIDEPWGWRPYAKTDGAEFRFSPSGAFMGYLDRGNEMAIISETTPHSTMREAMLQACFWASAFDAYPMPDDYEEEVMADLLGDT